MPKKQVLKNLYIWNIQVIKVYSSLDIYSLTSSKITPREEGRRWGRKSSWNFIPEVKTILFQSIFLIHNFLQIPDHNSRTKFLSIQLSPTKTHKEYDFSNDQRLNRTIIWRQKEFNLCHKICFSSAYIFATQCRRP